MRFVVCLTSSLRLCTFRDLFITTNNKLNKLGLDLVQPSFRHFRFREGSTFNVRFIYVFVHFNHKNLSQFKIIFYYV